MADEELRGVSKRKGPRSRRWVYKAVYERACAALDAAKESAGWPYSRAEMLTYGKALNAYLEARANWRRIRGWAP